jgi:hypothetical protein
LFFDFPAKVIESVNYSPDLMLSCSFARNYLRMKRIFLVVILFLAAFAVYWFKFRTEAVAEEPKQEPIKTSRHSAEFNNSFDALMSHYFAIKDAFVEADSVKAKKAVQSFIAAADSLKIDELKNDSAAIYQSVSMQLNDIKANAESILKQPNVTEMRRDFWSVSESIYPLLKSVHYEGKTLYWQNCPMAFGEDKGANWISNTEEIVNPYLGKKHPEYKATMLHCGEVKDSIKAQ